VEVCQSRCRRIGLATEAGGGITQTELPPDLSDLIGKYAFGDVGKEGKEKK